jgi:hypothetical protein
MATIPARLSKGKQTTTQIITLLTNPSAFLSDTFSDLVYPSFLKVVEAGSLYYFFEYRTSQMEQRVEDKLERLGIRLNAETVESSVSKRLDSFTHDLYEVTKALRGSR